MKREKPSHSRKRRDRDLQWTVNFKAFTKEPTGFWNVKTACEFNDHLQKSRNILKTSKKVGVSLMACRMFLAEMRRGAEHQMTLLQMIKEGRPFRAGAKEYGKKK